MGSFGSNDGDSARAAELMSAWTGMIDPTTRPRITSARRVIFLVMITGPSFVECNLVRFQKRNDGLHLVPRPSIIHGKLRGWFGYVCTVAYLAVPPAQISTKGCKQKVRAARPALS